MATEPENSDNDNLIRPPFSGTKLEEEKNPDELIFTVRLNTKEKAWLQEGKKIIQQQKDSSALKQLAEIGFKCVTTPENKLLLELIFNNKRKNQRTGLSEFE